jgi:hypothetical protein
VINRSVISSTREGVSSCCWSRPGVAGRAVVGHGPIPLRKKSRNYLLHLVVPTLGFLIIAYVLFNADYLAKVGGIVWLGVGAVVFIVNKLRGRGVPQLAEEPAVPGEGVTAPVETAAASDHPAPPR